MSIGKPIRILNLYAGGGGNAEHWQQHEVTHVELDPERVELLKQKFPQHKVIEGDAVEYLLWNYDQYDFIWGSPPCPRNSRFNTLQHHKKSSKPIRRLPDFRQYELVAWLGYYARKAKWVIENVDPYFDNPIEPTVKLGRHLFWSNFDIPYKEFEINYPDLMDKRGVGRDMVDPDIGKWVLDAAYGLTPVQGIDQFFRIGGTKRNNKELNK